MIQKTRFNKTSDIIQITVRDKQPTAYKYNEPRDIIILFFWRKTFKGGWSEEYSYDSNLSTLDEILRLRTNDGQLAYIADTEKHNIYRRPRVEICFGNKKIDSIVKLFSSYEEAINWTISFMHDNELSETLIKMP